MTTITLLTPASITASGVGPDVDVSRLTGEARVSLVTLNTAGTSPTLACKLQGAPALVSAEAGQRTAGATDNKLRAGATTTVKLAAKFTQSGARSVKKIALQLKNPGTITAGKILTLTLNADSTGAPGAVIGTAATVLCSAVAAAYGWVVFTFANPVDLVDETVYHVVLAGDYDASATNCIYWRSLTVASGGTVETFDNTNWAAVTGTEKFEYSVDQYAFADIAGGGFTTVSVAGTASVQTKSLHARNLPAVMRVHSTIGGTSNPAFATAVILNSARVQEQ
jgi:hypothetical protein